VVGADDLEPGLSPNEQAYVHLQDIALASANLDLAYAATDWLALEGRLPLRGALVWARFLDRRGNDIPGFKSINHRDEVLAGPGDPSLGARVMLRDLFVDGLGVGARLGVTVPVGNIEPAPYVLTRQGKTPQHVFFGTGTFDPVLGLDALWSDGELELGAFADARLGLYRNRYDFLPPSSLGVMGLVGHGFGQERWRFRLHPEVFLETPARWGEQRAEVSGRYDLLLGISVAYRVRDTLEVSALAKVTLFSYSPAHGPYALYAPLFVGFGALFDTPL
jgi:hypothetical protein